MKLRIKDVCVRINDYISSCNFLRSYSIDNSSFVLIAVNLNSKSLEVKDDFGRISYVVCIDDFRPAYRKGRRFVVKEIPAGDGDGDQSDAEAENPIKARIDTTKLTVVQGREYDMIDGHPKVSISTMRKSFKKPVFRVVCITEEDGSRCCRQFILVNPRSYDSVSYGDLPEQLDTPREYLKDAKRLSEIQVEVPKAQWQQIVYGGTAGKYGRRFAMIPRTKKFKLLLYRLEVWMDGNLLTSYVSDKNAYKRLGLPEDWHEPDMYPDKFKYLYSGFADW